MTRQSEADNAGLIGKAVTPTVLSTDVLHTKSHEAFHRLDRRQRLVSQDCFRALPHFNLTIRKKCYYRREQRVTSLCVGNHSRGVTVDKSDQTVGCSQVNTDYAFHNASLSFSTSRDKVRR